MPEENGRRSKSGLKFLQELTETLDKPGMTSEELRVEFGKSAGAYEGDLLSDMRAVRELATFVIAMFAVHTLIDRVRDSN
jgi:hypothetical protein